MGTPSLFPTEPFSAPLGICLLGNDTWTTLEFYGVAKTTASGTVTNYAISVVGAIRDICVGPDGFLWACDSSLSQVWKIDPTNPTAAVSYAVTGRPWAICVGSDGNLWVSNNYGSGSTHQISSITTAGVVTAYTLTGGVTNTLTGITTGPDGNLWLAGVTHNIVKVAPGSSAPALYAASGALPVAVCAAAGLIFFTDANSGGLWVTTTAGVVGYFSPGFASYPNGIVAGPDGNLWITDDAGWVFVYTTAGVQVAKITLSASRPDALCVGPPAVVTGITYLGPLTVAVTTPTIWVADANQGVWQIPL